jgi:DNA-binding GntR family transcriptional regulator
MDSLDASSFAPLQSRIMRPLLQAIFTGEIPGGSRLIEQDIASKMKISRAPVREALREMAGLGVIELRPNRGAIVRPFNKATVRGIYRVRMALEAEAAFLAAGKIGDKEAASFEAAFDDLIVNRAPTPAWSERAIESDGRFHEMIALRCGVDQLTMEIRRYGSLVREIRQALGDRFQFQEEAIRQHIAILRGLASGSGPASAEAMRLHVAHATEHAVESLFPKER